MVSIQASVRLLVEVTATSSKPDRRASVTRLRLADGSTLAAKAYAWLL